VVDPLLLAKGALVGNAVLNIPPTARPALGNQKSNAMPSVYTEPRKPIMEAHTLSVGHFFSPLNMLIRCKDSHPWKTRKSCYVFAKKLFH